jgi:hypothetical protein
VVTDFVAPQIHHAEVVHLRHDSTSSDNSTMDEAHNGEPPSHMVMQSPMAPMSSILGMNGHNEMEKYRKTSSGTTNENREFRDPAYANLYDASFEEDIQPKKKGFFASIFKKPSSGHSGQKSRKSAKKAPKSDYVGYNCDSEQLEHEDMDVITAHQSFTEDFNFPSPQPLTRERSMSKPTNLDEILQLQEEEERFAHELAKIASDNVFTDDPFFQQQQQQQQQQKPSEHPQVPMRIPIPRSVPIMMSVNDPIYANTNENNHYPPSHETTQEIDVDAALGYCNKEATKKIKWPVADPIPPPPPIREELQPVHIQIDYAPLSNFQDKPKKNFFRARSKKTKPGRNDEVSYYIEEFQPEPQSSEQQDMPFEEELLNEEENMVPEVEATTLVATKPSFFNFKAGRKAMPLPKDIQILGEDMDETSATEESTLEKREDKLTNWSKKKQQSQQFNHSAIEQPEELAGKVIEEAHDSSMPICSESSRDSSPRRLKKKKKKKKKKKGLPGFFKSSSRTERSSIKKYPEQIGLKPPVDISHLVEEEEQKERDEPNEYTQTQIKISKEPPTETISVQVKAQDASSVSTEASSAAEPQQKYDNELPHVVQSFGSLPTRGRSRARKKSGGSGFAGLFSSSRPVSRSSSQTHLRRGPSPESTHKQLPVMVDNPRPRSRSLARGKKSDSGKGFSGLFGIKPSPSQELRRKRRMSQESQKQPIEGYQLEEPQEDSHPPMTIHKRQPPLKSTGGLSGLFSMQPRHARRTSGRSPSPTINNSHINQPEVNNRRPSLSNSMSSIASKQRRESKGLSNFLGASPLQKSGRRHVPRSRTFPALEPRAEQHQEPDRQPLPQFHTSGQHSSDAYDKIELAPNQLQQQTNPNSGAQGPLKSRVMGRQSGHFRKQPTGGAAIPAELTGPHELPLPPPSSSRPVQQSTELSVMKDNDTEDHDYDDAISSEPIKSSRKSTSSMGRTESFKQSKTDVTDDQRHIQKYNSLPRLSRGKRRPPPRRRSVTGHQDPENRSLGGRPHSRHGRQGDEQCKMM